MDVLTCQRYRRRPSLKCTQAPPGLERDGVQRASGADHLLLGRASEMVLIEDGNQKRRQTDGIASSRRIDIETSSTENASTLTHGGYIKRMPAIPTRAEAQWAPHRMTTREGLCRTVFTASTLLSCSSRITAECIKPDPEAAKRKAVQHH